MDHDTSWHQGIANFRFPSLSTLTRRKMPPPPRPHLDVRQWLNVLDLSEYALIFEKYQGVEDLLSFSESDIKDLGVKNSAHRARIMSSLVALKAKHEKGSKRNADKTQRHSVAVDSSRHVQQNGSTDFLAPADTLQTRSLCNLTMEATPDPTANPAQLRKALEWELSLDTRDLRSHAWYHGAIPRQRAEEILDRDGDFLVRDCTSQPGDFVLTCRWKGQALHFVINKVVIQPDTVYERVQYQFEDDAYDTVPDLITFYVGSGKPISAASGARIQSPRNRMYPLSFYATKYGLQSQMFSGGKCIVSPVTSPAGQGTLRYNPYNSYKSPVHSPPRSKRETPPKLPAKQRSHSLTPETGDVASRLGLKGQEVNGRHADGAEKSSSADGIIQESRICHGQPQQQIIAGSNVMTKYSTHSLPRTGMSKQIPVRSKMVRVTSDPALSPCMERRRFCFIGGDPGNKEEEDIPEQPPPKPSRVPSKKQSGKDQSDGTSVEVKVCADKPSGSEVLDDGQNRTSSSGDGTLHPQGSGSSSGSFRAYHTSGSDSGNGSGDSAQSSATGEGDGGSQAPAATTAPPHPGGVVIKNPRYKCDIRDSKMGIIEYDSAAEESIVLTVPDLNPPSAFDLENFQTLLLPSLENKPLDATALQGVKMTLQETGPRILANHITKVDLELVKTNCENDLGLGISSGIELCALPHGHQLRLDLIERTECLKLLVAVTILTCTTESDRAEVLHKWIQVAVDTKTALGNLYSFCGIMMGLCMPQIQRLSFTWHVLRQKNTDSAFNFEAKLRPTLKSMNECTNPQAPNTTIPHLLPFLLLQERSLEDILNNKSLHNCLAHWENSTSDFGLGTMFAHLEAARKFSENLPMYRRNAEIVLGDAKLDDLTLDAFRTEFQLKFLWGSRGAYVSSDERHAKFEQVLNVMSEKCEPSL